MSKDEEKPAIIATASAFADGVEGGKGKRDGGKEGKVARSEGVVTALRQSASSGANRWLFAGSLHALAKPATAG
jgi:hypothetical protein